MAKARITVHGTQAEHERLRRILNSRKSAIIEKLAKETGLPIKDIKLSGIEPEDLAGSPNERS